MARLRHRPCITPHLQASSLVEVLIAMVILLSVFAIGMLIFANLTKSSRSQQSKAIRLHMEHIRQQIVNGEEQENPIVIDSVAYYIAEEYPLEFPDRKKIKIYAEHPITGELLDSLVSIVTIKD